MRVAVRLKHLPVSVIRRMMRVTVTLNHLLLINPTRKLFTVQVICFVDITSVRTLEMYSSNGMTVHSSCFRRNASVIL